MRINFEFIEFPTLKMGENGTKRVTEKKLSDWDQIWYLDIFWALN